MTSVWERTVDLLYPPESPYLADPVTWVNVELGEHLWSKQCEIMESVRDNVQTAVPASHGPGKALALDTLIPTPGGWTTMGEIKLGDFVYDEQGKPAQVTGLSPIWDRPSYRVVFDDRTEVVTSGGHEWQVLDLTHRLRGVDDWRDHWASTVTVTTEELSSRLRTASSQLRWRVPCARPLCGEAQDLPMPAYSLGVWLGDGHTDSAAVTLNSGDAPELLTHMTNDGVTLRLRPSTVRAGSSGYGMIGVLPAMRVLFGGKFIPKPYLRSPIEIRLALLQGLMDTDGFACDGADVGIDLTCERLAADVAELVRSFGWKARTTTKRAMLNGKDCGLVYRLNFRPNLEVFRLKRKCRNRDGVRQASRHTQRTITKIELCEQVLTRCIEVDSPSHLYLATEAMIPTHNSFIAARIAAWWISVHPPGTAKVLTSAPTFDQVKSILWGELKRTHTKGDLIGRMNMTEWYIGDDRVAFGRKPSDPAKGGLDETVTNFQGEHADYLLVIFDEAVGIPKPLWMAANSLLTNDNGRILAIGNPDDPLSHFATVCAPGSGWNVIPIPLHETPRFTGEQVHASVLERMPTQGWLDRFITQFGMGTNAYKSKVLAQFPESALDGIIPWSYASKAMHTEAETDTAAQLGFDVSGSERGDESVIRERRGNMPGRTWRRRTDQSEELVDLAIEAIVETGATMIKIDTIGVGWGVAGHLRSELSRRKIACKVIPVNVSERSNEPKRFKNLRAEMWWVVGREGVEEGRMSLQGIDDKTLSELVAPKYKKTNGLIQVELKEDTKARLERSPDDADALLLAFYDGHRASGPGRTSGRQIASARIG